jgi:hypothetical protein
MVVLAHACVHADREVPIVLPQHLRHRALALVRGERLLKRPRHYDLVVAVLDSEDGAIAGERAVILQLLELEGAVQSFGRDAVLDH